MNVRKTVLFLATLQLVFSSIGYMFIKIMHQDHDSMVPLFATVVFVLMFVMFYIIFTGIKKKQKLLEINKSQKYKKDKAIMNETT